MKILITGTPGVGKTTLSKKIAEELKMQHYDITAYIKEHKLYDGYDEALDTYVFDEDRVAVHLNKTVEHLKAFIIDTHSPVVASDIAFDVILRVKCSIGELTERLAARGYSAAKITENIDSELLDVIGEDLEEYFEQEPLHVSGSPSMPEGTELTGEDAIALVRNKMIR